MEKAFLSVILVFILCLGSIALRADKPGTATMDYYGEIGCAHCDMFAEKVLPAAEEAAGINAEANYYDILSKDGYERCEEELAERGYSFKVFPVLVIGNNVYQGNSAIEKNLPEELKFFAEYSEYRPRFPEVAGAVRSSSFRLAVIPVILAGLIDGVNPCAFATMLFFISWIAARGGGRMRLLLSGGAFIAGVFLAYLGIGFGLLGFMRAASGLDVVRHSVRYLFSILALIFALFSLRDALLASKGNAAQMVLQLPKGLKRRIHSVIRENPSGTTTFPLLLVFSFTLTGVIVALLELACTGQIYFPAIAYMVQSGAGNGPQVFWLLLYNLAFILPLAGILGLAIAGVKQQRVREWFSRHIAAGKLFMALLFFLLAALIWVSGA
jgi:cytochrome c biogenesis protein CcdA